MLSAVWSHGAKPEDFYFNLPPVSSPIRHATFYWINILEFMIAYWIGYAILAFLYFSADWLPLKIREACHYGATAFLGIYALFIGAFIPLQYLNVVYVTDPNQETIIFVLILYFILFLEMDFVVWAMRIRFRGFFVLRIVRAIRRRFRRQLPDWGEGLTPI